MAEEASSSHDNSDYNALVDQLIRESRTTLAYTEVNTIFDEEFARLEQGARIQSFLHLLTYRSALRRIRAIEDRGG